MNLPTKAQAVAFGRHVISYAAGGVSALAFLHVISGGDASSAMQAISDIGDGVAKIAAGVGTLVAIGSGVYASISASPLRQLLAAAANPQVQRIVAPAIADDVPSNKVVAK